MSLVKACKDPQGWTENPNPSITLTPWGGPYGVGNISPFTPAFSLSEYLNLSYQSFELQTESTEAVGLPGDCVERLDFIGLQRNLSINGEGCNDLLSRQRKELASIFQVRRLVAGPSGSDQCARTASEKDLI